MLRSTASIIVKNSKINKTFMKMTTSSKNSLYSFGLSADNTFTKYLIGEKETLENQFRPRQIYNSHYTSVRPESVPSPYIVAVSKTCASLVGISAEDTLSNDFIDAFSGNLLLPGLDQPWCSNYGCHCYGHWFGQLGDGRAMSVGEILNDNNERYELQLKGCGRSPFSRGFDGRAVLRSSIREFLVSEAMNNLGVPSTRALCVIGTGQSIRRPWYSATSEGDRDPDLISSNSAAYRGQENIKYSPDTLLREQGAILCRVSKSFLRFSQLELFANRKEYTELIQLTNFVIFREFPQLLSVNGNESEEYIRDNIIKKIQPIEIYIELFRSITKNVAFLVSEWLRVGYTQGNMNSDNTLLAGRTLDYGPYGWLEVFNPLYQPFTSDSEGKFAFIRQPNAMSVNVLVLSKSFETIIKYIGTELSEPSESKRIQDYLETIANIANNEFEEYFFTFYNEVRRKKLGFKTFIKSQDEPFFYILEKLMKDSHCDFTIFWRQLSLIDASFTPAEAVEIISKSFYEHLNDKNHKPIIDEKVWNEWFNWYLTRLKTDDRDIVERRLEQQRTSPKYVLRNWMSVLAYEKAEQFDYSIVNEINQLLLNPYDEQSEMEDKYYKKTPNWARGCPGVSFMS